MSAYLALISIGLLLGGCGCPPDVKLGDIRLMKPNFLQLSGTESITYTNASSGETLVLLGTPMEYSIEKVLYASLCSKPPIDSQVSYYESVPFASKRYKSGGVQYEDMHFYYRVWTPVQGDTSSCVDLLSVADLMIVVSDRGKAAVHSIPLVKSKEEQTRIIADTILNNQRYRNVYCKPIAPMSFFTTDRGVVAFRRGNVWWHQTGFKP